jgi:hypothetical protein
MENDPEKQLAITLNNAQREAARAILDHVRSEIDRLSPPTWVTWLGLSASSRRYGSVD